MVLDKMDSTIAAICAKYGYTTNEQVPKRAYDGLANGVYLTHNHYMPLSIIDMAKYGVIAYNGLNIEWTYKLLKKGDSVIVASETGYLLGYIKEPIYTSNLKSDAENKYNSEVTTLLRNYKNTLMREQYEDNRYHFITFVPVVLIDREDEKTRISLYTEDYDLVISYLVDIKLDNLISEALKLSLTEHYKGTDYNISDTVNYVNEWRNKLLPDTPHFMYLVSVNIMTLAFALTNTIMKNHMTEQFKQCLNTFTFYPSYDNYTNLRFNMSYE
jgi:hypothetical protein